MGRPKIVGKYSIVQEVLNMNEKMFKSLCHNLQKLKWVRRWPKDMSPASRVPIETVSEWPIIQIKTSELLMNPNSLGKEQ